MALDKDTRKAVQDNCKNYTEFLQNLPILDQEKLKKIWKFESGYDFMYGQIVGEIGGLAKGYCLSKLGRPSNQKRILR